MELKCPECGYRGPKTDFAYVGKASCCGPGTIRRCPRCLVDVFCSEITEDEDSEDLKNEAK